MRKFGVLTAAAALLLLALAGTASAQSLRDAPAGGNEICDGADGFEGQAGPVEPVRAGFAESGCASGDSGSGEEGGGEEGGDEGGGESDPFCDGLAQFPEEMAPLTGPIGEGAGCAAAEAPGDEEVAQPPSSDGGGFNTGAIVLGETEGAPDDAAGTGALPATGAELLAGASLGLASLGLAARRYFG